MAKEGSVAPKERINIVYKPATGGAEEEVELPLKLLMIGDYTGRADDTPVEERKPINVDKDTFNEVMREQRLALSLNVRNRLSGEESDEVPVNLNFQSLRDFDPEGVVRQVPELRKLLELREALTALKGPLGNIPAFRKRLQNILSDEGLRQKVMQEVSPTSNE